VGGPDEDAAAGSGAADGIVPHFDNETTTFVDPFYQRVDAFLLGRRTSERTLAPGDFRGGMPRFSGENLQHNLALVEALRAVADAKGASVAQLAIAWVLFRGEDIVPLVGARRRDRLSEALGALQVELTPDDTAAIERAVPREPVAGERYDTRQMAILDSERGRATAPSSRTR